MRRAIVIGGSLGGLFAGAMLMRSGWGVTIVERTEERLEGRGAGVGLHPPMLQALVEAGAKVDGSVGVPVGGRTAFARDGAIVGELHMPQFLHLVDPALLDAVGRLPRRTPPSRRRPR